MPEAWCNRQMRCLHDYWRRHWTETATADEQFSQDGRAARRGRADGCRQARPEGRGRGREAAGKAGRALSGRCSFPRSFQGNACSPPTHFRAGEAEAPKELETPRFRGAGPTSASLSSSPMRFLGPRGRGPTRPACPRGAAYPATVWFQRCLPLPAPASLATPTLPPTLQEAPPTAPSDPREARSTPCRRGGARPRSALRPVPPLFSLPFPFSFFLSHSFPVLPSLSFPLSFNQTGIH